jgi:hypothetical protein
MESISFEMGQSLGILTLVTGLAQRARAKIRGFIILEGRGGLT